jgi:hypothetical protein
MRRKLRPFHGRYAGQPPNVHFFAMPKTTPKKGAPSEQRLFLNKSQLAQAIPASIRTIDYWRQQGDLAKVLAALARFEVREKTVNSER